ncbi:MAG: threonine synthase [Candidatus Bathyarchaeia archaeon]
MQTNYTCIRCGRSVADEKILYRCPSCNDLLDIRYVYEENGVSIDVWETREPSVWRYRELLPIKDLSKVVSLKEGGTPLYRCANLMREANMRDVYVKNEGENPTGSFKDRGMTVAISKVMEVGGRAVACASTGNTAASLAAYAAKAGLRCILFIPKGRIARGKLVQATIFGAEMVQVEGNFDTALKEIIRAVEEDPSIFLMNSINPFRIEGQKTLAFEISGQLGYRNPDVAIIPVGNAGNITALWKGFKELNRLGLIDGLPIVVGVQAQGASPIASAFRKGQDSIERWADPETIASAIRIGNPVNWRRALEAAWESRGEIVTVSDAEILAAQRYLARREGIFVEPASAATVAYLRKGVEEGHIDKDEEVVCITTGHGLKDPDAVFKGEIAD